MNELWKVSKPSIQHSIIGVKGSETCEEGSSKRWNTEPSEGLLFEMDDDETGYTFFP